MDERRTSVGVVLVGGGVNVKDGFCMYTTDRATVAVDL